MSKKKKGKQQYSVSPEEIRLIEKDLGVEFIDFYKGIFKSKGIVWKPVKNGIELLCAAWDNVPMLQISSGRSACQFVPLEWEP